MGNLGLIVSLVVSLDMKVQESETMSVFHMFVV